ncbi:MAG: hypothetical protein GXX80_00285 [Thermotogaceae bacterium]|nr:hypothetical protein [Thermotogaceae bacterium]
MAYFKLSIKPVDDEEVIRKAATPVFELVGNLIITNDAIYCSRRSPLDELLTKLQKEVAR